MSLPNYDDRSVFSPGNEPAFGPKENDRGPSYPLLSIWFRPRATIRRIIRENPDRYMLLLMSLIGVAQRLNNFPKREGEEQLPPCVKIGMAFLTGPFVGMFGFWLSSHLMQFADEWMGVRSDRMEIKSALVWGGVPLIL